MDGLRFQGNILGANVGKLVIAKGGNRFTVVMRRGLGVHVEAEVFK